MKKLVSIILCLVLVGIISGCTAVGTNKDIKQEMTIVIMPSPPKCKTTDNVNVINEILSLFKNIEKAPLEDDVNGGWSVKIQLNVDGEIFNYTMSDTVFTDLNGEQYAVDGISVVARIKEIYKQLDVAEEDYI